MSREGKIMGFYIIKEVILIGREKEFSFFINGLDFGCCYKLLYLLMAGLIVAMDNFVADSPYEFPLIPSTA
jgi:hypothetical protein